jgi:hypothetical protein
VVGSKQRKATSVEKLRNRLGVAVKHGDPDEIEAARAALAAAKIEKYIREVVDAAPPLTTEQRERLALLLGSGPDDAKAAS